MCHCPRTRDCQVFVLHGDKHCLVFHRKNQMLQIVYIYSWNDHTGYTTTTEPLSKWFMINLVQLYNSILSQISCVKWAVIKMYLMFPWTKVMSNNRKTAHRKPIYNCCFLFKVKE